MRISDIITESVSDEVTDVVRDMLSVIMANDHERISTKQLQALLQLEGYSLSIDQIIMAVDQSGYASSVDKDYVVPADELPDELQQDAQDAEQLDDLDDIVGDLAQGQATQDIESEL